MHLAFSTAVGLHALRFASAFTPSISRARTTAVFATRIPRRSVAPLAMSAATETKPSDAPTLKHGYQYDLFVIGAGSGGVRASRIAANHGAKVAVAEEAALGGTCVNVGCVPKKLFVYGSHYGHDFEDAKAYGWDIGEPKLDWARLIRNKNNEIERLNGIYGKMLDKAGVKLVRGSAKFVDPHTIQVGDQTYTADKVLIAVGGKPFVPDFEGNEHVITSNEAFYLEELPKRAIISGGGYISVEFATIFDGYGVDVIQLYRSEKFMRGFDEDVRDHLAHEMRATGIDVRFNSEIKKVVKQSDGSFEVTLLSGDVLETDLVMFATGRNPITKPLNLDAAGVKTGKSGKVSVDDYSKTNVDHIYAVGDVTDRVNLTPVAIHEGNAFADTVFGNNKRSTNYEYIPTAVFSNPSIGMCGLTEAEAREKYGKHGVDIYKTSFRPMKHTLTKREGEKVFMKLVVERESDKVVGVHICDAAAGEVIQLVGVAMKAGVTKKDFDSTMPVHPVSAEEIVTIKQKEADP